jgi:small conductance mechanosensitive channel
MMILMQISRELAAQLTRAEVWIPWIQRSARVAVILGGAWLVTRIAKRLLGNFRAYAMAVMQRRGDGPASEIEKRANTLVAILKKLAAVVIWLVAIVTALTELTFHIEPLLAGLGVAGLAVGLGAQALIKDWLSLARIEGESFSQQWVKVDLHQIIGVGPESVVHGQPGEGESPVTHPAKIIFRKHSVVFVWEVFHPVGVGGEVFQQVEAVPARIAAVQHRRRGIARRLLRADRSAADDRRRRDL